MFSFFSDNTDEPFVFLATASPQTVQEDSTGEAVRWGTGTEHNVTAELSHIYAFKLLLHPVNVCSPLQETLSVQNAHAYCLRRQIWSFSSTRTVSDFILYLLLIWTGLYKLFLIVCLIFCTRLAHLWEHSNIFKYLQYLSCEKCTPVKRKCIILYSSS